jgi:hypothetical protein
LENLSPESQHSQELLNQDTLLVGTLIEEIELNALAIDLHLLSINSTSKGEANRRIRDTAQMRDTEGNNNR